METSWSLYSVSDEYIRYLRSHTELSLVFDSKEGARTHTRKYLGAVIKKNELQYFVPLSSPKSKDYVYGADGLKLPRKDTTTIVRLNAKHPTTEMLEVKGKLLLNNMIPVPQSELLPYDPTEEFDKNYRDIIRKELIAIIMKADQIAQKANVVYRLQTCQNELYIEKGLEVPGYIKRCVPFKFAEEKAKEWEERHRDIAPSTPALEQTKGDIAKKPFKQQVAEIQQKRATQGALGDGVSSAKQATGAQQVKALRDAKKVSKKR